MAIVELNKITLYGAASQKETAIEQLQDLGCLHLVSLAGDTDDLPETSPAADARRALRYLDSCPKSRRQVRRSEKFDYQEVVSEILAIEDQERDLHDEQEDLLKAIADLKPWGDFEIPSSGEIGGMRFWFFTMPPHSVNEFAECANAILDEGILAWQEVSQDHQNAYIIVLSTEQPENLPGKLIELDPRPLSQLESRLEDVDELLDELRYRRIGLTQWRKQLRDAIFEADNLASRRDAARWTLDCDQVFVLRGWAPKSQADEIRRFAKDHRMACTVEPPAENDQPPTLLENPEKLAGGEGLVTFYKTPDYHSWDPSLVAYLSFAIFFAMIMADAGYGLVIGVIVTYFWKKMGNSRGGRRFRNVLASIAAFSVVYGVICGSYFGLSPADDSVLGRLRILDATSQEVMMPIAIIIGVIHLSLANLVTAWLNIGKANALSSLGWVAVMAGATAAGIGMFGNASAETASRLTNIGGGLLVCGLLAVFLFSSERPLFSLSLKNHALRVLDGLQGLTGLSGLFGDVLSYLRLFALGLSSAKLAETFNTLAGDAWDNAGFGVIVAIGILILGHTLNLLLAIMSGVVHGLRLNCIEFFKWSLPEEGYLFNAFAKKGKEI